jgi:hypothetical protein
MPDKDMFGNGLAGERVRFGVAERERHAGVVRAVEDTGELAALAVTGTGRAGSGLAKMCATKRAKAPQSAARKAGMVA